MPRVIVLAHCVGCPLLLLNTDACAGTLYAVFRATTDVLWPCNYNCVLACVSAPRRRSAML